MTARRRPFDPSAPPQAAGGARLPLHAGERPAVHGPLARGAPAADDAVRRVLSMDAVCRGEPSQKIVRISL